MKVIYGGSIIAMISDCVVCISIERLRRVKEYDADLWLLLPSFFLSNSQCKSSVHGDNQRTAVDLTKVLHAEVCGTFVDSGCVCVLFKPNWIVRSKGGRWEEIDGNWSIPNQDQARQASPCFGSRIKDETQRISPLLDQKTRAANQGARTPFEGRRQK